MKEFIETLNKYIQDKYNLSGLIKHSPTKGTKREKIIATIIGELLPDLFIYGDGEIISPDGLRSKQQDLVICSKYLSVMKLPEIELYPVDSVTATVAIKSKLNRKDLKEDFENIKSVKCMKKTIKIPIVAGLWKERVQCNIFTFESVSLERLRENITSIKSELNLGDEEMFDNLCVLNRYLISNNKQLKKFFNKENEQYVYLDMGDNSLVFFLDSMLNEMSIPLAPAPIFAKYLGSFDVKCLR